MFSNYTSTIAERFMSYVKIDTQSNPRSTSQPSTEKQKDLSRLLVKELLEMGIKDAELDEYGYVYATIPANTSKKDVPVICFCAHVDTSPDCSGTGVKPILHTKFDGRSITLPDDENQIISIEDHPYLEQKIGDDIITASGTTLLGADDKAGVAVIMEATRFLTENPEIKHGTIRILFTPDEEIGRGVDKVDIKKLGADFGYTLDGGQRGTFEDETFSADGATVTLYGVTAHPGYAKGKLVNALKLAGLILSSIPRDRFAPESTEGREGFLHPVSVEGTAEKVVIKFICRDFKTDMMPQYSKTLESYVSLAVRQFPGSTYTFESHEQYRNMKDMLDKYPKVSEYALEAIERAGMVPERTSARGGTDGSRLSFMGLPCPNLFTGEMAFHGKHEYVSVQDMEKSMETVVHLAAIWEERS